LPFGLGQLRPRIRLAHPGEAEVPQPVLQVASDGPAILPRLLFQQPSPRLQLGPQPVPGLPAEVDPGRLVEVSRIPTLAAAGHSSGTGSAVAVWGRRVGEQVRLGAGDLGVVAGACRVPLLGRDDYPDIVQGALAQGRPSRRWWACWTACLEDIP